MRTFSKINYNNACEDGLAGFVRGELSWAANRKLTEELVGKQKQWCDYIIILVQTFSAVVQTAQAARGWMLQLPLLLLLGGSCGKGDGS